MGPAMEHYHFLTRYQLRGPVWTMPSPLSIPKQARIVIIPISTKGAEDASYLTIKNSYGRCGAQGLREIIPSPTAMCTENGRLLGSEISGSPHQWWDPMVSKNRGECIDIVMENDGLLFYCERDAFLSFGVYLYPVLRTEPMAMAFSAA